DWNGALLAVSFATLPLVLLWGLLARGAATRPARDAGALRPAISISALFRHRGLVLLTVGYGLLGYFEYLLFHWTKYYYQEVLRLPESESTTYTLWQNVTMVACTPIGGWLSCVMVRRYGARWGLRIVPMAGMAFAGLFLVAGAVASGLPVKVTALSLALGLIGACEGPFWTAGVRLGGAHGGTTAGFMNTGG